MLRREKALKLVAERGKHQELKFWTPHETKIPQRQKAGEKAAQAIRLHPRCPAPGHVCSMSTDKQL